MNRARLCCHCGHRLPKERQLKRCRPCNAIYMRAWYKARIKQKPKPESPPPGVDIDRIHHLRGAVRDPKT